MNFNYHTTCIIHLCKVVSWIMIYLSNWNNRLFPMGNMAKWIKFFLHLLCAGTKPHFLLVWLCLNISCQFGTFRTLVYQYISIVAIRILHWPFTLNSRISREIICWAQHSDEKYGKEVKEIPRQDMKKKKKPQSMLEGFPLFHHFFFPCIATYFNV